jgi:hypothetical protein
MDRLLAYLNAERGRRGELASALNISPSAISMWDCVPIDRVKDIARITGIPAADLRPDLAELFATPTPSEVAG